jgi:hypothetical protein
MRCAVALQTCFAFLLAFFVAPFEHVHAGAASGHDHGHSATMHAHFYRIAVAEHHGTELVDTDDDHDAVWSVDTFTLVLSAGMAPFIPTGVASCLFAPRIALAPVEVVEERGHDPPLADRSIPRAPPA